MEGKQACLPGSKSAHDPKPRWHLSLRSRCWLQYYSTSSLKMGKMRPSKLLASLQTEEDQLICPSTVMLFREISVGSIKGLKENSLSSKREMQIPHLGQINSMKLFVGKQLCKKGTKKAKALLGSVQQKYKHSIQNSELAKLQMYKKKKRNKKPTKQTNIKKIPTN